MVGSSKTGLVAAPDGLAAEAGASMLRSGGNAVDAAVAAAFAIGVVEPQMSGLGGATWIVAALREQQKVFAIDGPFVAPGNATPDMYTIVRPERDSRVYEWPAVVGDENILGPKAACVPGTVAALCLAQQRLGRLSLKDVLQPAIRLADDGFDVNWFLSACVVQEARRLVGDQGFVELFMPEGLPLRWGGVEPGDRLRQRALATTLEKLGSGGQDAFYRGSIGSSLIDLIQSRGGIMSRDDLSTYSAQMYEIPKDAEFRDAHIMGGDRTGCPSVVEALNLFELASQGAKVPDEIALAWVRALRYAYVDRLRWFSGGRSSEVPWKTLLSKEYAASLLQAYSAGVELPDPAIPDSLRPHGWGQSTGEAARKGCTSHISVVDRDGNFVSLTQTIVDNFGARLLDPSTGVILNDAMAHFDPRPGNKNSVGPGVQSLPAVSPMIVSTRARGPIAAVGGMGGRKIISSTAQVIARVVAGAPAQEAIDEPRLDADSVKAYVDMRWPISVTDTLRAAGFDAVRVRDEPMTFNFARMGVVTVQPDGSRCGAVDAIKPGGVASDD